MNVIPLPGEIYRAKQRPRFVRVLRYELGIVDYRSCDHTGLFKRRGPEWAMKHTFFERFVKIGVSCTQAEGRADG